MARKRPQSAWTNFTVGAVILAVGIVFWLDRLGRIDAHDWLEWWPLAVIAIGLSNLPERRWGSAAAGIAIGSYFLLSRLGYDVPGFWTIILFWPLLFSVAGVALIMMTLRTPRGTAGVRAVSVMAGNHVAIGSREFGGGQAIAVMGGCEIDLGSARNVSGDVAVDVLAFWGGIEIRVPRGWNVVNQVAPVLGGFEDKTFAGTPGAPRLVVRGAAIMGGVEVMNVKERAAASTPEGPHRA